MSETFREAYRLFPLARYSSAAHDSPVFRTHRRTRWTVELRVAALTVGAGFRLRLQTSPSGDDANAWEDKHDFGVISTTGTTILRSFTLGADPPAFSWGETDLFVRATVTEGTGLRTFELLAWSRFLDTSVAEHVNLLPRVLRDSPETRQRYVDLAERYVLRALRPDRGRPSSWYLHNDIVVLPDPDVAQVIREQVAVNAGWLQARDTLISSASLEDQRAGQRMGNVAPTVDRVLSSIMPYEDRVVRNL